MSTTRTFVATVAVLLACLVRAQGEEPQGGQYYIHGIFNPVIADVQKIDLRPQPFDSIIPPQPLRYDMLPVKADVPARVDSIAAAKLNVVQPQQKLYHGFVKAGFGLYTTPLGELYYDQTRSRKNGYGIHLKHFSSNGGLDDVGPSDYSLNNIDGFYKHVLEHHEVSGSLGYDRRRISYYGYPSNDSIESVIHNAEAPLEDDLKQIYNDIGFAARVRSLYRDSTQIAHDVGMEVHQYTNLTGSRETNLVLKADLSKEDGSETYAAALVLDNNAYLGKGREPLGEFRQNGTLIGLSPNVSTRGDRYFVKVGVGMYLDALGKTTFHFYPQAYLSYSLFEDILVPYAGVDGAKLRNSFRSLTRENPFLNGAPQLNNTSKNFDLYGGLRGSFSSHLGFDVRLSRSLWKNKALFISQDNDPYGDQFAPIYDEVGITDISGLLHYHLADQIDVHGRIDIYTYDVEISEEPWNLPPYQIGLGASYDIRQKLILKAEAQLMGKRSALAPEEDPSTTATSTVQELDGYLDLYLGAEYRYNKRLSVFLEVSNLSASKYERWYDYPVQRTLFLGGATFRF